MSSFSALPIKDGSGDWHANRFRIYFQANESTFIPESIARHSKQVQLASEFTQRFATIFNGSKGGIKNLAQLVKTSSQWNSKSIYRFTMDIHGPDIHDDYVGVVASSALGFAVQTLQKDVSYARDIAETVLGGLLGKYALEENRDHFLAGRRSWVICDTKRSNDVLKFSFSPKISNPIYFLETAAIERYSSWIHNDLPVGNWMAKGGTIDNAIINIWTRLLVNYIKYKGFKVIPSDQWKQSSTHGNVLFKEVRYQQGAFGSKSSLKETPWVRAIMKLHPALKEQLK